MAAFGVTAVVWGMLVAGGGQYGTTADTTQLREQYARVEAVLEARGKFGESERRAIATAIVEESARAGYDPFLILGIIDTESDFRHEVVSSADARGLMQIQPKTLQYLMERNHWPMSEQVVERDPARCVMLGVRYVRQLHDRFHSIDAALMAYNMGPTKFASLRKTPEALEPYRVYPASVHRDAKRLKGKRAPAAELPRS
ncbi:MAG: transglycosylase SLT domain-containing protein [Archangiaceae bacterium]|nr:transglycosylase SLT domain-containing protein [Archangiaceae bacterium]